MIWRRIPRTNYEATCDGNVREVVARSRTGKVLTRPVYPRIVAGVASLVLDLGEGKKTYSPEYIATMMFPTPKARRDPLDESHNSDLLRAKASFGDAPYVVLSEYGNRYGLDASGRVLRFAYDIIEKGAYAKRRGARATFLKVHIERGARSSRSPYVKLVRNESNNGRVRRERVSIHKLVEEHFGKEAADALPWPRTTKQKKPHPGARKKITIRDHAMMARQLRRGRTPDEIARSLSIPMATVLRVASRLGASGTSGASEQGLLVASARSALQRGDAQ